MDKKQKKENTLLGSIEKASGYTFDRAFKTKPIHVLVSMTESKSNPLTVMFEKPEDMVDNLIHELIHVLFTQNYKRNKRFRKKWDAYWDYFYKETTRTKSHIVLHAVHYLIEKKNPKTLNRIRNYSQQKPYIRSWEIVEKLGAQKIVDMLR